ncbi:MAG: DNA polymerase III subunit epsilon [Gammaproteobacteria bacterium]|nr:DNA polymerase III subunit epsilon [Gammaproteobacteria bacterium]
MFNFIFGYESQRRRQLKKVAAAPLKQYLATPFPDLKTPIDRVPILALDFETTGLNAKTDHILSIGYVAIDGLAIQLESAHHQIIHTIGDLREESVIVHHITDDKKSRGLPIAEVMPRLLEAMCGRVLLVHYAHIEKGFLRQICQQLYGLAPVLPIIDTLVIARKRLDQRTTLYSPGDLRLFNLRQRHNLPRYRAHNALSDAIATAELFFAELELKKYTTPPPLKSLIQQPWSR